MSTFSLIMQEILNHSGEYGLYFIGILFIGVGYVGSVMPSLPGPPIALIAIYLVHFTVNPFSTIVLFALTILALSLAVLDYFLPVLGTKKFGGSKSGVRGSTIGLILGVILTLMTSGLGIILLLLGPFVGAYFGEKYAGNSHKMALNSATGSFLGFLLGAFGKIVIVTIILIAYLYNIFAPL